MYIQFSGKLRALSADMVQNTAKINVRAKLSETNQDAIDTLAELCSDEVGVHAFLRAEGREPVDVDCRIPSVRGDFAANALVVTLQVAKSEVTRDFETTLVEWCRMEREVSVEVSSRQMSFRDLETGEVQGVRVELKRLK
jgi:hypothetical protein